MSYRVERTERIRPPLFAGVEMIPAMRAVWEARDRHGVSQHGELACEADPEAWVEARACVDREALQALCRACPIQPECLAMAWVETRIDRGGAIYGGHYFPARWEWKEEDL